MVKIKVLFIQKYVKHFILNLKPTEFHCVDYDVEKKLENCSFTKINCVNFPKISYSQKLFKAMLLKFLISQYTKKLKILQIFILVRISLAKIYPNKVMIICKYE